MAATDAEAVLIVREDLETLSDALTTRYPMRAVEVHRMELLQRALAAASGLTDSLAAYVRLASVHRESGHTGPDLTFKTAELFRAFVVWSEQLRVVSAELRRIAPRADAPVALGEAS